MGSAPLNSDLPPGFVLDSPPGAADLPSGFVLDTPAQEEPPGLLASAAAGAATGLVGAATWPVAVARVASKGVERLTGKPSNIDWDYWNPAKFFDDVAMPPHNPSYEGVRNFMSVAAPVIVSGGLSRFVAPPPALAGRIPPANSSFVGNIGRELGGDAAKTAAIIGGAKAGEIVGENTIGGDFGRDLGAIAGGGAGAAGLSALRAGVHGVINHTLTEPATAQRLADADMLGVRPSIGLIGNRRASEWEDAGAGWPIADIGPRAARTAQTVGMAQSASDLAGRVRAQAPRNGVMPRGSLPSGNDIIDKGTLGADASALAERVLGATRREKSAIQEDIMRALPQGDRTPVVGAHDILTRQINRMQSNPAIGEGIRRALDPYAREIAASRDTVVDPQVEAALQASLRQAKSQVSNGLSTQAQQGVVSGLLDQIRQNRDISYGSLKDASSRLGARMENGEPLPQKVTGPLRNTERRLMRLEAQKAGMPPAQFDAIQKRTSVLFDQQDALDRGLRADPGERSYASLLNSGRLGTNASRAVFDRRAHPSTPPAELEGIRAAQQNLLGDILEHRLLGENAGALAPRNVPSTFSARNAHRGWATLGSETKDRIAPAGSELRQRLEALSRLTRKDAQRPTRATPNGSNTLGLPTRMMAVAGASGYGAVANPALTAAGLGLAYALPRGFSSEAFARYAARNPVPVAQAAWSGLRGVAPAVVNTLPERR